MADLKFLRAPAQGKIVTHMQTLTAFQILPGRGMEATLALPPEQLLVREKLA